MPCGPGHIPEWVTPGGKQQARAGIGDVTTYPSPTAHLFANTAPDLNADWHVLVLWGDESETDLRGVWGPYSTVDLASAALEELRQWPLDGRWDIRRLNKFVARKAATQDQIRTFSWQ